MKTAISIWFTAQLINASVSILGCLYWGPAVLVTITVTFILGIPSVIFFDAVLGLMRNRLRYLEWVHISMAGITLLNVLMVLWLFWSDIEKDMIIPLTLLSILAPVSAASASVWYAARLREELGITNNTNAPLDQQQ